MSIAQLGSMVWEDTGDSAGATVVMLHGLGGSSNSFQPLVQALDAYRVIRPDLPGAGRSPLRPGISLLTSFGDALHDCLQALQIRKAHIVGHSMGTLIAQHFAATKPACVSSLTLFGPILEPPEAARVALRERSQQATREGLTGIADAVATASLSAASKAANPVTQAFVRESIMRQSAAGYAKHCELLSEAKAVNHHAIRCPTLLIAGSDDPVAPVSMAQTLQQRIDGAKLEVLPSVGHWMMLEAPQKSTELLTQHLLRAND